MGSSDGPHGLLIVDKPQGLTSHDVVAKARKLMGTRKVGHAGTLDPLATGVLVLGIGKATRLLGHLALTTKAYSARIRLGESTVTDDAEGEVLDRADASGLTREQVIAAMGAFVGDIQQVPAAVSAIKVDGQRSYARVRAGEEVDLPPRPVHIARFTLNELHRTGSFMDADVDVECSSGTYVRSLARDLGAVLGVGGHITMLRRTSVGPFALKHARTLDELAKDAKLSLTLSQAVDVAFPRRDLDADEVRIVAHGGWLPTASLPGVYGAFSADGEVVALLRERSGRPRVDGDIAAPVVVFAGR